MAQQAKSFFYSSFVNKSEKSYLASAMKAFLDKNFEQFKINLEAAKNAGENLSAVCRNNGETLATIFTKFPDARYMDIAARYDLDWSAKNSYGETVEFIRECHAAGNNPNKGAILTFLDSFFAELEKYNAEQSTIAKAIEAVDAVNKAVESKKEANKAIEQAAAIVERAVATVENAVNTVENAVNTEKAEMTEEELMQTGAFLQEILQNIEKLQDPEVNQALQEYVNVLKNKSKKEVIANAEANLVVALKKAGAEDILNSIIKYRDHQLEANGELVDVVKSMSNPEIVKAFKQHEDADQSFSSKEGEELEKALDNAIENLLSKITSYNPELGAIIKQLNLNYFGYTQLEEVINSAAEAAKEAAAEQAEVAKAEVVAPVVEAAQGIASNAEDKVINTASDKAKEVGNELAEVTQEEAAKAVATVETAVENAENKTTEAEVADMLTPAVIEPTDAQVAGDSLDHTTTYDDAMNHMRDFAGF